MQKKRTLIQANVPDEVLVWAKKRAAAEDRSVSYWLRMKLIKDMKRDRKK